ncbi:MAG: hypothetical protein WC197_07370 [Candidatus Gastranaerophilaceae bacterium]|jgi:hypothetical protein
MSNIFLYFPTPTHYDCCDNLKAITVTYEGYTYFIDKKKLYYVLSLINLLGDYLYTVESKKHNDTSKWLSSKSLANDVFLETISGYKVENKNTKKIINYFQFSKDEKYFPKIEEMINTSFQKAFLFDYLSSMKLKFNTITQEKIKLIKTELKNIENIENFKKKRNFYKQNIFQILLNNFLSTEKNCLDDYFQMINNFYFSLITEFSSTKDFNIYTTAEPKDFINGKFRFTNILQRECIKERTLLKLNMTSKKVNYFDFDEILKKSFIFTKSRLDFEKNYINSLVLNSKTTEGALFYNNTETSKELNGDKILKTKEKIIHKNNFADSFYFRVEQMNFSLGTDKYLSNYAIFLNLDNANIQKIKSLLFQGKNELESKFVNLYTDNKSDFLPVPLNYAKIDYL